MGDCTVPLNFWYCKSPGLAIPLCALHKSVDVELYMQFASTDVAHWTTTTQPTDPYSKNLSYDQNIFLGHFGGENCFPLPCQTGLKKHPFEQLCQIGSA